jgi:hypothetical protein
VEGCIRKVQLDNQMLDAIQPVVLAPAATYAAPGALRGASHVYMYDKVFSDATSAALAAALRADAPHARVLVSYRRPESWRKLGLARAWQLVGRVVMATTGNQSFTAYIMAR